MKEMWESASNVCFGGQDSTTIRVSGRQRHMMNILDNVIPSRTPCRSTTGMPSTSSHTRRQDAVREDQYGIEVGKPSNFLVLDADSPFEAVRPACRVLASIRHGEYLFQRPDRTMRSRSTSSETR